MKGKYQKKRKTHGKPKKRKKIQKKTKKSKINLAPFFEGSSPFPKPWKINMEPENDGLEDDFPFHLGGF